MVHHLGNHLTNLLNTLWTHVGNHCGHPQLLIQQHCCADHLDTAPTAHPSLDTAPTADAVLTTWASWLTGNTTWTPLRHLVHIGCPCHPTHLGHLGYLISIIHHPTPIQMAADSDADSDGNRVCLQILPAQISSILEHTEASTGDYLSLLESTWTICTSQIWDFWISNLNQKYQKT